MIGSDCLAAPAAVSFARTVRTQIVARPEPDVNFPNTVAETRYPGPATEAALMLWFKTVFEAVSLPKLNGVANQRRFCAPPRFLLIRAADVDPIDNMAIQPEDVRSVSFHQSPSLIA
jgi:hypothetical protein